MTFLLHVGTKREIKRTGTCKDASHPEPVTAFSRVFYHSLKTGMSTAIPPNSFTFISMYLFQGTHKTLSINPPETLHGKITLSVVNLILHRPRDNIWPSRAVQYYILPSVRCSPPNNIQLFFLAFLRDT